MPVTINEISTEIQAFDASALLSDEVVRALAPRIAAELRRLDADKMARDRDATIVDARRVRR